jgi:Rnl2 family RNA ligase
MTTNLKTSVSLDTTPNPESPLQLPCNKEAFIKYPKQDHLADDRNFPSPSQIYKDKMVFFATEKIDGCNLGVWIPKEGEVSFFSRNGENASCLFTFETDHLTLLPFVDAARKQMKNIVEYVTGDADGLDKTKGIYFYGEYFGHKINRRVDYGSNSRFRFYDLKVVYEDGQMFDAFPNFFIEMNLTVEDPNFTSFLHVPKVLNVLNRADLGDEVPLPFVSPLSPTGSNAEGWVVTACGVNADGPYRLRWKHKDPEFKDSKETKRRKIVLDNIQTELKDEFQNYLTKNRAIDLLSKTTCREVKRLIPMLIEDAREDFKKKHPELENMEKKAVSYIFNAGKTPYFLIRDLLEEESQ